MHAQKYTKRAFNLISASVLGSLRELGPSFIAEDAPGDKDTQHGTNGAVSNPSFSSFASRVSKNAKELWKQRQAGMGVTSRALSFLLRAGVGLSWGLSYPIGGSLRGFTQTRCL